MKKPIKLSVYPIEFSKRVVIIRDQESTDILSVPKKYADYIITAINSHEKLVEALMQIRDTEVTDDDDCDPYGALGICKDIARDTLKEAGEQK